MNQTPPWQGDLRLLWMGQFLVTAGLTIIVPLLPFYLEELGSTDAQQNRMWTGLALAAPAIPMTLMAPIWGRLGDSLGRKRMVVRALVGISASVLAMGFARTPAALFLCRLAQGTFGGVDDAAAAFASTHVPREQRGRALGRLQSATAAGALLGPLVGGWLSLRWGFAPLITATGVLIALCALFSARGLSGVASDASERDGPVRPSLRIVGAAFCEPAVRSFLLAGFCIQVGSYALIGLFAEHVRTLVAAPQDAVAWVGSLQSLTWAATLVGTTYWGRRNDRLPVARNFALGATLCAASVALQAWTTAAWQLTPLRLLQGFGSSALGQSVFMRVAQSGTPDERGLRIGVANSMLTLGHLTGAFASALVLAWVSAGTLFLLIALCFVCAAVLVTRPDLFSLRRPTYVEPTVSEQRPA